jgi:formate dehydrogenase major subunit
LKLGSPMSQALVPTICPYCGAGCGFYIKVEEGRATGIKYMPDHPVSRGSLCSKGNAALEVLRHPGRLQHPLKKSGSGFIPISWEEALDLAAEGLGQALQDFGPQDLGFLGSSKCTNEENYLFQKLARSLGSPNVDNCARLCHASTVVGLGKSMGACATTNPVSDLANSRCIFIIGSNLAENHPAVARWVLEAKDAGSTIIVADPRRTPTSWLAEIFLQIKPGTDLALLNGMMHVIVEENLFNRKFLEERTRGFEALADSLKEYTPERAAAITGVPAGDIMRAARAYARSPASATVYSMGVTQHAGGTDNVQALANLFLICGHIGRPGTGIFPLRGQNNVQGACDMGTLTEFYPGYRRPEDPRTPEIFGQAWGGSRRLPGHCGLTALEMMDASREGRLRAMYIMGEDPVNSDPHASRTREALEALDFLVVQDIFLTDTARLADVVLPAAAWAEKEGTFTSTERRVQWICRAVSPPGEARPDLWIVTEIARRMDLGWEQRTAEEVLEEIKSLVPTYRALSREMLRREGFIWIHSTEGYYPTRRKGSPILHQAGFPTPDGKALLAPVHYRPPAEETSPERPLFLTTGRLGAHYNAGSMTLRSPSLLDIEPQLFVELNPSDALARGIGDGDGVVVHTARGDAHALARITERVASGVVFLPFHFPGVNALTLDVRDPQAKIPELKVAACDVRRA